MKDVVSRQQALRQDVTPSRIRHLLRTGRWQRIFPGVYLVHSGTPTWRQRLKAATLARGEGAVASLECALNLWGLADREPPVLTLAEPEATRRTRRLPGVRVRRRRRLSTARRHGIPVTSAAQTVLDVLALPGRTPDDDVALITRAVRQERVTVAALLAELEHHPRHPRRAGLAEILAAAADGLESVAEVRYVERVEAPHGLPRMERQAPSDGPAAVRDGRSRRMTSGTGPGASGWRSTGSSSTGTSRCRTAPETGRPPARARSACGRAGPRSSASRASLPSTSRSSSARGAGRGGPGRAGPRAPWGGALGCACRERSVRPVLHAPPSGRAASAGG